jgi:hypothetical protein
MESCNISCVTDIVQFLMATVVGFVVIVLVLTYLFVAGITV